MSRPESTIVSGLPGPGGAEPSAPITSRHHSSPESGSACVAFCVAVAAGRPLETERISANVVAGVVGVPASATSEAMSGSKAARVAPAD